MNVRWRLLFFAAMCALIMPSLIWSQSMTGTISGTVVDPSDQVIPGAKVTAINEATGDSRDTVTGETGDFSFLSLLPATYTLQFEMPGFQTFQSKGTVLIPNARLSVGRVKLSIGSVTETITVEADKVQVSTVSSENSSLLSRGQFEDLPVRSRDLTSALRVLPGVQMTADTEAFGGTTGFGASVGAIGGARATNSVLMVDGVFGNELGFTIGLSAQVNMDAVQEVTVMSGGYQAEYYGNAGANISMTTRSGSRDFHGGAYYYVRNEFFNANDFFRKQSTDPTVSSQPPLYRFHTMGITFGGPLPIPKLNVNRDKLFFFLSFDETISKLPSGASNGIVRNTMPTALERAGNFSQSAVKPRDPTTGQRFLNDIIPADRIDPDMQKLLNIYPLPNVPFNGSWNYEFFSTASIPQNQPVFRIDYKATPNDSFYLKGSRWYKDTANHGGSTTWGFTGTYPYLWSHYQWWDRNLALNYTHIWTPKIVSDFTAGIRTALEAGYGDNWNDIRAKGTRKGLGLNLGYIWPQGPTTNEFDLVPNITAAGTSILNAPIIGFGSRFPSFGYSVVPTISHATTVIHGKHTFKAGVFWNQGRDSDAPNGNANGVLDFSNTSLNPLDSGNSFANQLLGNFSNYQEISKEIRNEEIRTLFDWYVQDNWKATRQLTLDYGLRFSYAQWYRPMRPESYPGAIFYAPNYKPADAPRLFQPAKINGVRVAYDPVTGQTLSQGFITAYVPGTGNLLNGIVKQTDSGVPQGFRDQSPILFMPRVGFSWDPFGDGKTAIRGGGGVFYQTTGDALRDGRAWVLNPPTMVLTNMFYGNTSVLRGGATPYPFPQQVYGFERANQMPVTYNYSLGIQRDLGHSTMADVKYVGSVSRHMVGNRDINTLPLGVRFNNLDPTTGLALADNLLRPYPGYATVTQYERRHSSNYNGIQAQLNRRFTTNLQFGAGYTFSKSLDYSSADRNAVDNYRPLRLSYARSDFDQKHVMVVNWMYDLPSIKTSGALRAITSGWEITGIGSFASGSPQAVTYTTSPVSDWLGGGDAGRVNLTCNPNLGRGDKSQARWFNTSCIAMPAKGDYGNASRDVFNRPGRSNWDLTLFRTFNLGAEGRTLSLRWELYNALNQVNFASIDGAARFNSTTGAQTKPTFGQALLASAPRQMQFSLRLRF